MGSLADAGPKTGPKTMTPSHPSTIVAAILLVGLSAFAQQHPEPRVHFRDVGRESGLTTVPPSSPEKSYLIEMMGGGVAIFDCDNDGRPDILVVGDSTTERYLHGGDPMVTLYHQNGHENEELHFSDTTITAGLTTRGWGMGVAVGDFDNDGLSDIYVTGYGHNVLYRHLGGCKFEDVTERARAAGGGFSV